MIFRTATLLTTALCLLSPAAFAASATAPASTSTSSLPLEITAQKALEWNRDKKQYIARVDAKAVQGEFSVKADTLTADYREGAGGNTEIYRLTAEGHVNILSGTSTASGDKAVYEVDSGKAVITGSDLKLQSTNLIVTAKERFEYYANEDKLIAFGRPLITSGTDTLEADQVTAWMNKAGTKKTETSSGMGGDLKRAEADGNVIIVTPNETATSKRAIYDATTNTAELLGNAKVKSGQDVLEGDRAVMDLTKKVSQMFGSGSKDGRVKGVFFPGKAKAKPAAAPVAVKADIKPEVNTAEKTAKLPSAVQE